MSSSLRHKFPHCVRHPKAYAWLQLQNVFGLAPNTIEAYARALEEFFTFCASFNIDPSCAERGHVVGFIRELSAVVCEPARNRLMLAFAYDAALRWKPPR